MKRKLAKAILVRVDRGSLAQLDELAKSRGTTRTDCIRLAVADLLTKYIKETTR